MPEQRFETRQIEHDLCIGDTVTGEYRPLAAFIPSGAVPAYSEDRKTIAAAIVRRMNGHRSYLPDLWSHDRQCFVYEDGWPA